jgi:hypothetical protein
MTPSPDPAAPDDRRIAQRFQPAFGTICQLDRTDSDQPIVGLVWNVSRTGVSMLLADPPERGTVLSGALMIESGGPSLPISLRVVHVRTVTTGDFLLGGQFSKPLEPDELKLFLTPPPKEPRKKQGEAPASG